MLCEILGLDFLKVILVVLGFFFLYGNENFWVIYFVYWCVFVMFKELGF